MSERPARNQPRSREEFERALREEISVSEQFGLTLSVLVAVMEGGWDPESENRAVGTLRMADPVSRTEGIEMAVVLPNTGPEKARTVERRLRGALPGVRIGLSTFEPGDAPEDVLNRARSTVSD